MTIAIVFSKVAVILYPQQNRLKVLISSHSQQNLLSIFIIIAIWVNQWMQFYLMVLIFLSIMSNGVEHLFMYLLVICISALEKCLVNSLPVFNWIFFYCCFTSFLGFLHIKPLSLIQLKNIFFHSIGLPFDCVIFFAA